MKLRETERENLSFPVRLTYSADLADAKGRAEWGSVFITHIDTRTPVLKNKYVYLRKSGLVLVVEYYNCMQLNATFKFFPLYLSILVTY